MRCILGLGVFVSVLVSGSFGISAEVDGVGAPTSEAAFILPNNISSNGAFAYGINIRVPEFDGTEPNLSLNYSSSNRAHGTQDNLLGIGWQLGGLSQISKVSPGGGIPFYDKEKDIFFWAPIVSPP